MPKLKETKLEALNTASNYKFSATKHDALEASEYTLAEIVMDESGSVWKFHQELEHTLVTIRNACQKSPRAENLLLRVSTFAKRIRELHGFKPLKNIADDEYVGKITPGGCTKLHEATHEALESIQAYAKILADQEYTTNGIIFIVTDGGETENNITIEQVAQALEQAAASEKFLESLTVILIGINSNERSKEEQARFQKTTGITRFIDMGEVTEGKLAKLGEFVSQSISNASVALNSGTSQTLSFTF